MGWTRRTFLKRSAIGGGALLAAGGGTGYYSYAIEPRMIRQKEYVLKSPKWPAGRKPLTAAIAADFHVGCPSVPLEAMAGIVERLNAIKADIIFLVGDFQIRHVLGGHYVYPGHIAEKLAPLKAPLGVYAVLGNHDWWKDGPGMWQKLEEFGIKVLENDSVRIEDGANSFWVSGIADDSSRTPDIGKTLQAVTTDEPVVMLSHDPAPFLEMPDRPVVTLAGHTHGGQVSLPFFGPIIIPGRSPIKYAYGHVHEEGRDLIVTSGLGTSILPVRFNRRPEIIKLTIQSQDA